MLLEPTEISPNGGNNVCRFAALYTVGYDKYTLFERFFSGTNMQPYGDVEANKCIYKSIHSCKYTYKSHTITHVKK